LHLRKVFASQSRQSCTLTLSHQQGRTLHVQLDSIPSLHASKQNNLSRSTITDITERKELEEALKASEILFRRLFEETREGVIIIDGETGHISDANPFLMEMLGYTPEDLLGKSLWEIGLIMDNEMRKSFLEALQKKGYVRYGNIPIETQHGRHTTAECISSTFTVNQHKIIQCHLRENSIQYAHSGAERRVQERRSDQRAIIKQQQEERQQHLQTEESLHEALVEVKNLRERLVSENIYFYKNTKKTICSTILSAKARPLKKHCIKWNRSLRQIRQCLSSAKPVQGKS
jgi:PAS domain S-box-containing protein